MSELNLNEPTDLSKVSKSDLKKDDIDDDFDDDDAIPAHIREARLNELKMRARELQQAQIYKSDSYKEISEEEFLQLTTKSKKCIIHFFHPDFRRCDIMHTHLQQLVAKYPEAKFAKVNVEKAKFFVAKLNIQILPAVLCFLDGVLKHRLIGFDQFGNNDSFPTKLLEKHLWKLKFLKKPDNEEESDEEEDESEKRGPRRTILNSKANQNTNDSDSD